MKIKRFLKPLLIIIAILILTLSVSASDLYGTYDQRIKITIDHNDIDSNLTWFPVTVFLTSSQGEEVFTEFDADEDFDRIAFTTSDEATQIYADCELFDDSESKAIYHVSKTGWTVSSTADTDIYLYYDNDAGHNTSYISKSGNTAAQSVWDSNFKAVYHMQDNTTSTILDSTSNNNDGTKKAANEPIEATGKVGQGQNFDGANDYIEISSGLTASSSNFTFETVFNADTYNSSGEEGIVSEEVAAGTTTRLRLAKGKLAFDFGADGWYTATRPSVITTGNWYYSVATYNNIDLKIYENNSVTTVNTPNHTTKATTKVRIGNYQNTGDFEFDGIIDEVRVSSTARSSAWIAATYDSLYDTLLTYGSEEVAPTGNALWFGMNF